MTRDHTEFGQENGGMSTSVMAANALDDQRTEAARPDQGGRPGLHPIVGMTNSASARIPVGQRVVMVLSRV